MSKQLSSIRVRNLSFRYSLDKEILKDVNFLISPGEKVAIMGQNGAGKSTISQILSGEITDYEGEIHIPAGVKLVYASQVMPKECLHWSLQDFLLEAKGLRESLKQYFLLLDLLAMDKSITNYQLLITNEKKEDLNQCLDSFSQFLISQNLPELQVSEECAVELMCEIELITNDKLLITNKEIFYYQALKFLKKCPDGELVLSLEDFLKRFEIYFQFLLQKTQIQKYARDHFYDKMITLLGELQEQYEHAGGHELEESMRNILELVGLEKLDGNLPIELLSGGQKNRLIMAQSILKDPDILILDEPTNNLDKKSFERLQDYVKHFSGTLLVISHDAEFLNAFVEKVLYIDSFTHGVREFCGTYEQVKKEIQEQMEREKREKARIDRELDKKKELFQKRSQQAQVYSGSGSIAQAAKRLKGEIAELEEKKEQGIKEDRAILSFLIPCELIDDSLMAIDYIPKWNGENVEMQYYSYQIEKSQCVLIAGVNGSGKSHFLKSCVAYAKMIGIKGTEILPHAVLTDLGLQVHPECIKKRHWDIALLRQTQDERFFPERNFLCNIEKNIWISPQAKMGYYSQDFSTLDYSQTVQESMEEIHPFRYQDLRSILAKFLFYEEHLSQKVGTLSEGQKALLSFARLIFLEPNLLLLDEPTNHINFRHIPLIKEALKKYRGTIVLISHDEDFIKDLPIAHVFDMDKGVRVKGKEYFLKK